MEQRERRRRNQIDSSSSSFPTCSSPIVVVQEEDEAGDGDEEEDDEGDAHVQSGVETRGIERQNIESGIGFSSYVFMEFRLDLFVFEREEERMNRRVVEIVQNRLVFLL